MLLLLIPSLGLNPAILLFASEFYLLKLFLDCFLYLCADSCFCLCQCFYSSHVRKSWKYRDLMALVPLNWSMVSVLPPKKVLKYSKAQGLSPIGMKMVSFGLSSPLSIPVIPAAINFCYPRSRPNHFLVHYWEE